MITSLKKEAEPTRSEPKSPIKPEAFIQV